jgi:ubiquinone/menaquinone biosynthesis C-methylase UbiE
MERELAAHRRRLAAGLSGRVIEVGAGNGLNFAHYPAEVSHVLAVEPEPYLRGIAHHQAASAAVPIEVVAGVAEELLPADATFDAAVASLVLCSVIDPHAALREIHRVLRPGGELRFFEHVRAETRGLQRVQRALDATVWPVLTGGCHAGRDTVAAIESAGFSIDRLERLRIPESPGWNPTAPHVIGIAFRR